MKRFAPCLCVALLSFLFVVPVFAASYGLLSVPVVSSWSSSGGVSIGTSYGSDIRASTTGSDVFCFGVQSGGNAITQFVAVTSNSTSFGSTVWAGFSSSRPSPITLSNSYNIDGVDQGLRYNYYGWSWSNFTPSSEFPMFNSLNEGLNAFLSESSVPLYGANVSVPAGYVMVFKSESGAELRGSATFGFKSYPVNLSVSAFGNTGQGYGYLDSVPSGSLSFPTSTYTYFPWQKGEPRDSLGQSYNGSFRLNLNPSSGQYVYVYNPLYNPNAKDGPLNPAITVYCSKTADIRLYPLHDGLIDAGSGGSNWGSTSSDSYENPYVGSIDPDTGTVVFEDSGGNIVTPSYGGDNLVPDVDSSQSLGEAVKNILKEIVSAITGIFSLAYQAIISLVGLAGPFFGKLAALYSWLPVPVLSTLTSAMILAVTIGVIRAFL